MVSDDEELYALGNGIQAAWVVDNSETIVGLMEIHDHVEFDEETLEFKESRRSGGMVLLGPEKDGKHWEVTAGTPGVWEGFSITPSIACHTCPNHGFIINGKWIEL